MDLTGKYIIPGLVDIHNHGAVGTDTMDSDFDFEKWLEAFKDCNVNPEFYAYRKIEHNEILPWDHIDTGVNRDFLVKEHNKAYEEVTTPSCREKCSGCGAASFGGGVCFE